LTDVLVCGAGPAGTIAAIVLARAGARVRVLDRARFPRDKLCGDTVNPGALAVLARLGVAHVTTGALPVKGMIVTDESGVRSIGRYPDGVDGRALRRCALDAALVAAARQAGAEVEEGVLVRDPELSNGRVSGVRIRAANGREHVLQAPIVIAADGAASRLARTLGMSHHARRPRRWAIGAYFCGVIGEGDECFGEMHVRRGRYIGIAPMPGGLTNACVVTGDRDALRDPAGLLQATLHADRILRGRFAPARIASRPVCLGPLAVDNRRSAAPGVLLAGDAAGFVDPMTGDGLRFAFRGAELAARAALQMLEHGPTVDAQGWLQHARRREFAAKWRFNRALRALVGSPAGMRAAAIGAAWAPSILEHTIRFAGDVGHAGE
jgi:geranylgeranyl reductase family protein